MQGGEIVVARPGTEALGTDRVDRAGSPSRAATAGPGEVRSQGPASSCLRTVVSLARRTQEDLRRLLIIAN